MTTEKIPGWIKQVLMPELNEIKGELKAINTRIDSLESNLNIKFENVDIKIDSLRTEMNVRLDSIEKRIPVIEKITALELKIADIEKRLAVA